MNRENFLALLTGYQNYKELQINENFLQFKNIYFKAGLYTEFLESLLSKFSGKLPNHKDLISDSFLK